MGLALAYRLNGLTRPLLVGIAAATTCACASVPDLNVLAPPPIDQTSPVAMEVQAASNKDGPFPRLSDIPEVPKDIRPVRAWTRSIYDTLRLRRLLIIEASVAGPAPTDTEAFAKGLRDQTTAPTSPSSIQSAEMDKKQQTGAFVQGARERAKPPSSAR